MYLDHAQIIIAQQYKHEVMAELQIRGGIEDNSKIIFLICQQGVVGWCDDAGQTSSAGASYLFGVE